DLTLTQVGLGDTPRGAAAVARAVVGDDVGRPDQPGRLDGDQLRVAGSDPDAVEPPRGHRDHLAPAALAWAERASAPAVTGRSSQNTWYPSRSAITSTTGPVGRPQRRPHPDQCTGSAGPSPAARGPVAPSAASARTSASALAQPGRPVHALTPSSGDPGSTIRPADANARATGPALPGLRSGSSTLRPGMSTSSPPALALIMRHRSGVSSPSGTTTASGTRPSVWSMGPTGVRAGFAGRSRGVARGWVGGAPVIRVGSASSSVSGPPGSSATRQVRSSGRRRRNAAATASRVGTAETTGDRSPVSRPPSSNATRPPGRPSTAASAPAPATSPRPSSRANRNRPGSAASS